MTRQLIGPVVAALVAAMPIGASWAEEVSCPPHIVKRTVDNVLVTGPCTIRLSTVQGNVVLPSASANLLVQGSSIGGSVQAEGASRVRLVTEATTGRTTSVGGDVQIKNTPAGLTSVINGTSIGGTVLYDSNQAPLNVFENDVNGDVQVFQNSAVVRIRDNTIDGNLQCKSNTPAPVNGGGNVVGGNAEDQCAGFDN